MVKRMARAILSLVLVCSVTVAQEPRKIRGSVLDEAGAPIAGAAVGVYGWSAFVDTTALMKAPTVRTGADGGFVCPFDPTQHGYVVFAAPQRQSIACPILVGTTSGDVDVGAVLLVPGAQLIGRVRDETGGPFAGASIRVESSIVDRYGNTVRLLAGATSDAQGIFKVQGVPRSALRATVEALGCATVSRLVSQESPLDVTLLRAPVVRGRVVDANGLPIAGARVGWLTAERLRTPAAVRTAADGTYELPAPPVPRFRIEAYETTGACRRFRSDLLHGPQDGVELRADAEAAVEPLQVRVVDAATKQPIRAFRLGSTTTSAGNAQLVVADARQRLRAYEGEALLERTDTGGEVSLLVEADGYGFVVVARPETGPSLVVELGPEATLSGRVVDAETGKPMAGVAVRALPKGNSSGSGGRAADFGPKTDDDGRYTLRCLPPGEYGVQAHADGRPASPVVGVTVAAGADNQKDLTVPAALWLDLEFPAELQMPAGSVLRLGSRRTTGSGAGFFQHALGGQRSIPLVGLRARLGPLEPGTHQVTMYVPSRVRGATGTPLELGWFEPGRGPQRVEPPDLLRHVLRGTVDLSAGIPSERVAVVAWPAKDKAAQVAMVLRSPNVAGIDGAGRFALDLPAGDYCVQLADLATGLVFHTEDADITAGDAEIALRPEVHWLDVRCVPEHEGDPVVWFAFAVSLVGARDGSYPMFLSGMSGMNRRAGGPTRFTGTLDIYAADPPMRWLVPRGDLDVVAQQSFDQLRNDTDGYRLQAVATESPTIDKPEHTVTLRIPAPPSDADLRR